MKRAVLPAIILLLTCSAVAIMLGSWRPFAPEAGAPASAATLSALELTAVPAATETPTETATETQIPPPSFSPSAAFTISPTAAATARPTATATRTRTPTATHIPAIPGLSDESMTETAVPAEQTLDAIAKRAIATWTPAPGPSPTPRALDGTTNFLLLGTDLRPWDPTWIPATDVMMVLFLDRANGRAALLSFPRDLVVAIPHHDAFRINYVFQYGLRKQGAAGGAALVTQVLRDEFNIRVDHWAQIDFNGLQKIIDTLGGITVNVPCSLEDTIDGEHFIIPAGQVQMDYLTAKRYIQSRYTTSDTSRNFRQQRVLWAIMKKGLEMGALDKLPTLWNQVHDSVQTDLSLFDMLGLAPAAYQLDLGQHPERLHAEVLEPPAVYPYVSADGAWLFMPSYAEIGARLDHLFDAPALAGGRAEAAECPGK